MRTAVFIEEVTVIDPESQAPVDVSIYKDQQSGGMFGVDSSYIVSIGDDESIPLPFGGRARLVGD